MAKSKNKQPASKSNKSKSLAQKADRHLCYQKSVQSPENEVEFFEQAFREAYRRKPYSLREDFCGTFIVCCHWVASNRRRTAIGVDLCDETLQWGRDHNLTKLTDTVQKRVRLVKQDVRKRNRPRVDVLAAQNFSFWIFKTRSEVIEYFKVARSNLNDEGVMVMDMMGGGDCFIEGHVDKRTIKKGKKGFKYLWKQTSFNPVTHDASFEISFRFKDGSRLDGAFEYHWRFWSIPEVREMLAEAGFKASHVYFEVEDEDGEDTGEWERMSDHESVPCWLAYIVAVK
ncbi:MAG: class I SAM-dependent methyltransferase [Planctomycetota bacterium]